MALTSDRVTTYRTGRVGVCLIASMIYIALISVELFVPDWTEENKAEADANLAMDVYYNDDDEVGYVPAAQTFPCCHATCSCNSGNYFLPRILYRAQLCRGGARFSPSALCHVESSRVYLSLSLARRCGLESQPLPQ